MCRFPVTIQAGVHPNLEEGIRTFVKYFGGKAAWVPAEEFKKLGIDVHYTATAKTTEALKLWDTTQYGILITLQKEIYAYCKRNQVDFSQVYTHANQTYNEGYTKLGKPEVVRPFLDQQDGPIGGHCVIPNANILRVQEIGVIMKMLNSMLEVNAFLESQENAQGE